ncbi:hypothetical protein IRZ71_24550 [Flavobacterium sp. ANB]|uniref:hypothetical protein n=1 Tax=unclassified Flavobacterium TaxID=196869 RepID=UPI0012BA2F8A|nr:MULTISPECIES: hypothetical protein [unclassified Flavobacterium]MBF4519522.1 hypothetical protein [Flavobacterium sp. ANB]MTD72392.1 hypothetical protein [Flavobacterium sp. LC2016-13]
MNIIQLFSSLDLNKDQILEFGSEDYIRIEKKINFEKKINPEIDSNTSENLILALKEYKEEFFFVMSNSICLNFFAQNKFSKEYFFTDNPNISDEKVKHFITLFLSVDLISLFSLKLSKNTFENLEELDFLLDFKRYFSEEIIYKMTVLVFSKLDFAISQLAVLNTNKYSAIIYIKFKAFYNVLSHFATIESDQKMSNLLSMVIKSYNKDTSSVFFGSVIKSMAFYNAFNENITKVLAENSDAIPALEEDVENAIMPPVVKIIIAIMIFAVILFLICK